MSARKGASSTINQSKTSGVAKNSSSGILPRKRTRLTTTAQPLPDHKDSSSPSLSSASDSEESSRMVAAFRSEEGTDDNLRLQQKQQQQNRRNTKEETKKQAIVESATSSDDEEPIVPLESTASQQQVVPQSKASKLDSETLKMFENGRQKLDIKGFIRQMLEEETGKPSEAGIEIFRRKPFITIQQLQNRGTPHLIRNKVSDKFNRRDVQFYDLYIKKDNEEDLARLRDSQLPLDIDANQYYEDLEVEDFNKLFKNNNLISEKFGHSIKVKLTLADAQSIVRQVTEHPDLIQMAKNEVSPSKMSPSKRVQIEDPDLISLDSQLKQLEKEFGKSAEDIAEIFCKVSGRLNKMREYLEGKPSVVEWNYLEDLALTKPEDSPEFQVLLSTKGLDEIQIRREFLQATPVMNDEEEEAPANPNLQPSEQ